jgi:hypothetical protein
MFMNESLIVKKNGKSITTGKVNMAGLGLLINGDPVNDKQKTGRTSLPVKLNVHCI